MGSNETVKLGDRSFTPTEISSLILRELAASASRQLGQPVVKAVITVPAYISDAQRQATREAATLAGLEAVRILNEPTASLANGEGIRHTAMVYDQGNGTFDVSIVALEGDVTEVLASHGNNDLGDDDFNDLLAEHLLSEIQSTHGIDLRSGHPVAGSALFGQVVEHLRRGLSPEQIAFTLGSMDEPVRLSHETIYTALYAMPRGQLRARILTLLRRAHQHRRKRSAGKDRGKSIPTKKQSSIKQPWPRFGRKIRGSGAGLPAVAPACPCRGCQNGWHRDPGRGCPL
jgi:hypothetical protein